MVLLYRPVVVELPRRIKSGADDDSARVDAIHGGGGRPGRAQWSLVPQLNLYLGATRSITGRRQIKRWRIRVELANPIGDHLETWPNRLVACVMPPPKAPFPCSGSSASAKSPESSERRARSAPFSTSAAPA